MVARSGLAEDFTVSWLAAGALLAGENPYMVIRPTGDYPFNAPFYYPLTAAITALPVAWLPAALAGGVFFGISSMLLAYAILGQDSFRLPLFASSSFLVAAAVAQWSPLLLAAGLLPAASWLLACKPNLGIALFVYRPSWPKLLAPAGFLLASLMIQPGWPLDWGAAIPPGSTFHQAPVLLGPYGFLLLLAVLRWREPRGRLLLAMALLPQSMWFYDQLVLWAIPRSRIQVWLLTVLSWLAYGMWRLETGGAAPVTGATNPGQYIFWLLYLPALILVLLPKDGFSLQPELNNLALIKKVKAWYARYSVK